MSKQYRLKLDTKFIESIPAGQAAKFLNSGEIDLRTGVEIAIACLFAPLGAAIDGATQSEVERLIAISHTQMETYFALALSRCQNNFSMNVPEVSRHALQKSSVLPLVSNNDNSVLELNFEENIDLDDEV
jgi:ABC-type arginine transport system permease subunit